VALGFKKVKGSISTARKKMGFRCKNELRITRILTEY
jgi:hypothetical protein